MGALIALSSTDAVLKRSRANDNEINDEVEAAVTIARILERTQKPNSKSQTPSEKTIAAFRRQSNDSNTGIGQLNVILQMRVF